MEGRRRWRGSEARRTEDAKMRAWIQERKPKRTMKRRRRSAYKGRREEKKRARDSTGRRAVSLVDLFGLFGLFGVEDESWRFR